jgi:hypothetical protein
MLLFSFGNHLPSRTPLPHGQSGSILRRVSNTEPAHDVFVPPEDARAQIRPRSLSSADLLDACSPKSSRGSRVNQAPSLLPGVIQNPASLGFPCVSYSHRKNSN